MTLIRKFFAGLFATGLFFITPTISYAEVSEVEIIEAQKNVPENIYTWALSTDRANYYFNHQQMSYEVNEDGFIDLDTLIVPTVCIYDEIQIEDVVSKRRWNMQSVKGYEKLVGRASYLKFNLIEGTVQVTERVDLDDQWGTLDTLEGTEPVELSSLKKNSIECRFYRSILYYAKKHNVQIIKHSWGKLSPKNKELAQNEMPLMKLIVP